METYTKMFDVVREKGIQDLEQSMLPNPELTREPQ
jgi:hypothetical protein